MHTHPGVKSGGEGIIPHFGQKCEKWPKKWFSQPLVLGTQLETKAKTLTQPCPTLHVAIELLGSWEWVRKRFFHPQSATYTKQAKIGNIGQKLEVISMVPQSTKDLAYSPIEGTIVGLYKFGYNTLSHTWVPRSKGPSKEHMQIITKHDMCSLWRLTKNRA